MSSVTASSHPFFRLGGYKDSQRSALRHSQRSSSPSRFSPGRTRVSSSFSRGHGLLDSARAQDSPCNAVASDFLTSMSLSTAKDKALHHIDTMLSKHGRTTLSVGLPPVHTTTQNTTEYLMPLAKLTCNCKLITLTPKINGEQRLVFDAVNTSILTKKVVFS